MISGCHDDVAQAVVLEVIPYVDTFVSAPSPQRPRLAVRRFTRFRVIYGGFMGNMAGVGKFPLLYNAFEAFSSVIGEILGY